MHYQRFDLMGFAIFNTKLRRVIYNAKKPLHIFNKIIFSFLITNIKIIQIASFSSTWLSVTANRSKNSTCQNLKYICIFSKVSTKTQVTRNITKTACLDNLYLSLVYINSNYGNYFKLSNNFYLKICVLLLIWSCSNHVV